MESINYSKLQYPPSFNIPFFLSSFIQQASQHSLRSISWAARMQGPRTELKKNLSGLHIGNYQTFGEGETKIS